MVSRQLTPKHRATQGTRPSKVLLPRLPHTATSLPGAGGRNRRDATTLREAGLIATVRLSNTVLHTLTPIGAALLTENSSRADYR